MVYSTLQELFSDESRWSQGFFAETADGKHVNPENPLAVKFCLVGGYQKVYDENRWDEILFRLKNELKLTSNESLSSWNDHPKRKIRDIVDLVKKADV